MHNDNYHGHIDRVQQRMEFGRLCFQAVTMEQGALLGVPAELRSRFSKGLAAYRPENLEIWKQAAHLGIADGQYLYGNCFLTTGEPKHDLYN